MSGSLESARRSTVGWEHGSHPTSVLSCLGYERTGGGEFRWIEELAASRLPRLTTRGNSTNGNLQFDHHDKRIVRLRQWRMGLQGLKRLARRLSPRSPMTAWPISLIVSALCESAGAGQGPRSERAPTTVLAQRMRKNRRSWLPVGQECPPDAMTVSAKVLDSLDKNIIIQVGQTGWSRTRRLGPRDAVLALRGGSVIGGLAAWTGAGMAGDDAGSSGQARRFQSLIQGPNLPALCDNWCSAVPHLSHTLKTQKHGWMAPGA